MVLKSIIGVTCACLAVVSFNVSAALVSVDWKTAGDNLITRDTASGLEWLDVSTTIGFSYDDIVNNELSTGGEFAGFHYAVRDDVRTLFENAGIGGINQVASSEYFDEIIALANLLGGGTGNGGIQGGISLQGISGEAAPAGTGANWAPFLFWMPDPCLGCATTHTPGEGQATLNGTLSPSFVYTDDAGSWLIRETVVPIPAAAWLFGSGLIGLVGLARRRGDA